MTKPNRHAARAANAKSILPTLLFVGGSMAAGSASALELGDIKIQSALGQPLRASIAVALGPNEQLQDYCVAVSRAPSTSGLPSISNARIDIADGLIMLTTRAAVREPMVSTRLTINCPYTPKLSREYTMFLSPASAVADDSSAARESNAPVAARAATRQAPAPAQRQQRSAPVSAPLAQGARYRVQPGESLSEIAQRIENRQIRLWPAVNALFEANPDAFIDADPNKLKAGSWLNIPEFVGNEVQGFAAAQRSSSDAGEMAASTANTANTANTASETVSSAAAESSRAATPAETIAARAAVDAPVSSGLSDAATEVANGRVGENLNQQRAAETIVIPDTAIEDPIPAAESPNRGVARIQPAAIPVSADTNWLMWIAGGGLGLIVLLLLFGRRLRSSFGSTPIGAAADVPARRASDMTETMTAGLPVLDDDSPTDQNLALDASLEFGHDFDGGIDLDFGDEAATGGATRLDLELPASDDGETDVIAAPNIDTSSILESEVLPEDDNYDMSVIMDITKMPRPEDITEKDLKAIEIAAADSLADDSYTISDEVDYDILEQDYQDELTATQALNFEIEKAAQELSKRLDAEDDTQTNVQIADVSEMDVTTGLPAQNDSGLTDLDDTNVNETLEITSENTALLGADEKTVEMPADAGETVEMPTRSDASDDDNLDAISSDGDRTVEVITRDDDTVEMEVEGGRVNTKGR